MKDGPPCGCNPAHLTRQKYVETDHSDRKKPGPELGSSLREAVRALKAVQQQDMEPFLKLIFNDVEYALLEVSQ